MDGRFKPARAARRAPGPIVAIVALIGASAALAIPAPTGSAGGITLARMVQRAYLHVRAQSYSQRGFVWMTATQGKASTFRWIYGGGPSAGLYPAAEHATLALSHGRLLWWQDDLTPQPCSGSALCARVPVNIVANAQGRFYAYGTASSHTCYAPLFGTVPYAVGRPVWFVGGRFQAPVGAGSGERLISTYPWDKTQSATELDIVAKRSHRLLATRVAVSASGSAPAFTYSASYRYPSPVPRAPSVKRCA